MADPTDTPVLRLQGLKTWFHTEGGLVKAVDGVSFTLGPGRTLGLVGESGSGKSITSLTIMHLLPTSARMTLEGSVALLGRELSTLGQADMRKIRGRDVAMIFQEPMTALNPVLTVGEQVMEAVRAHQAVDADGARARALALFEEVGIPQAAQRLDSYPHELSGGQKQRVMIAMALACDPRLLIADEPTTAQDVTIQAQVLDLLRRLRDDRGMSILFITHDLGVIAELADEVAVMYRGRLVEYGDVLSVFSNPRHPYTRGLLACRPRLDNPYRVLPTVDDFMQATQDAQGDWQIIELELTPERERELREGGRPKLTEPTGQPVLTVEDLKVWFPRGKDLLGRPKDHVKAVDGVSFQVWRGQTLGLVGESGCGKTTTGRAILRLIEPTGGRVVFQGRELIGMNERELRGVRRQLQIVFQDPYGSLNPRLTVEQAITEPMKVHGIGHSTADRRDRAADLLHEVGLKPEHLSRYPHEFSGGQRQRICIARHLSLQPDFIIFDESVSALDVSVQAQVLNLLNELQRRRGLTYIFISHDLSVVKFMSDVMCVMQGGRIVEAGPSEAVYADPQQEYTRTLIAAIPRDDLEHIQAIQARRGEPRRAVAAMASGRPA